jgi:hypothetical protein
VKLDRTGWANSRPDMAVRDVALAYAGDDTGALWLFELAAIG